MKYCFIVVSFLSERGQRDTTKADALDVHRPQLPKNGHGGKRWDIEVPYVLRMHSMVFVRSRRP